MENIICAWQALSLSFIVGLVVAWSMLDLTRRFRSLIQPWVTRRVLAETSLILRLQKMHHRYLDSFFSILSGMVSVPFYTAFLPFVFWSEHTKLARQMTLLMALCVYIGNSMKDLVSVPRPSCPPVRRVTFTHDEKEFATEYGLPSTHAFNTVCLSGYLLHYVLTHGVERNGFTILIGVALVFLLVTLISIGRIYLGMHSFVDVVTGICVGLTILAFWLTVHVYVEDFIVSEQNVIYFWASLSFLLCFAYPTPESPTPSYEYHISCNGVAFGIVVGTQQTQYLFYGENVQSSELPLTIFFLRVLVGIPTILAVKFCGKALAKLLLPIACKTLGIPIRSSSYIQALKCSENCSSKNKSSDSEQQQLGYLQKVVHFSPHRTYDVDTAIRFLHYTGLAWSAVGLVPLIFSLLKL